ncbi:MAG: hypothetical protein Q9M21_01145 [Mariprofundaceae bacterium]|nr:hypothetical protein [Mariprofundaceae bacterium]
MIFHALFTPGEIIWVGFALPVSYEGLTLGFYLSLKLCEMFVCALLLGRLLPMQVWLKTMAHIDVLQHYLTPYLRLMPVMLRRVPVLVRRTYRAWCLEPKKVKKLANYITELIIVVEKDSRRRAKYTWDAWDAWDAWDKPKTTDLAVQKQLADSHLNYMGWLLMTYEAFEFAVRYLWS